ncbi:hypothetical protein DFJ73DRAFT_883787 [Zopfochytrium polystomum]|nr:hypothetical protein DFJ73DRAFT_883787 [Zopfochytrium polystomum]
MAFATAAAAAGAVAGVGAAGAALVLASSCFCSSCPSATTQSTKGQSGGEEREGAASIDRWRWRDRPTMRGDRPKTMNGSRPISGPPALRRRSTTLKDTGRGGRLVIEDRSAGPGGHGRKGGAKVGRLRWCLPACFRALTKFSH